jgi:precorrin-3B synthase
MSGGDALIRGWCPGALRPMESGDGLIVRLRISGGILDVALAACIARWSVCWGNGQIDLSSRANLQLRGLSVRNVPALHDALAEWGLLDDSEAGEAVRNVVSSPLAGLDPTAVVDVRPIVRGLERRLVDDASLHALPGKFGFAIDDGGLLGLGDVPADVLFVATGPAFEVHLAGVPVGCCRPDALVDVAAALGQVFLRRRTGRESRIRRMRDLVVADGSATIALEAGLSGGGLRCAERLVQASALLGVQPLGSAAFVGVGLPFGRVAAEDFAALVSVSAANGAMELRLTPWRTILVPVPSVSVARFVLGELGTGRFVLGADDARCRIAACSGAPSCARGTTPVHTDAAELAAVLGGAAGIVIHVSGCEKGCAHPGSAAVTLVARDGRYDLVRDGPASGLPALRGLTLEQASDQIRTLLGRAG